MENWTHVGLVKYARRGEGIVVVLDPHPIEVLFSNLDLRPLDIVLIVLDENKKINKLSIARDLHLTYKDLQKSSATPSVPHFTKKEIDLLRLVNVKFNESYIDSKLAKFEDFLNRLPIYLDSINIIQVSGSYSINVTVNMRNKPGDDDSISVDFTSSGPDLDDNYLDVYLRRFFPQVNKNIYNETAFAPARQMLDEFKQDTERWENLEVEAIKLTQDCRTHAIEMYSKSEHFETLSEFLKRKIWESLEKEDEDFHHSLFYSWIDNRNRLKSQICNFYGGTYKDYLEAPH